MKTWRPHQFKPGGIYRVNADVKTATSQFVNGEEVEFVEATAVTIPVPGLFFAASPAN
jgi:hypothetical protein